MTDWIPIFDASGSWPTNPQGCYADGFRVVAGYRGSSSWKEFTATMRDRWRGAGFGIAAMFESTIDRALSGYNAGVTDGKAARAAWKAIGYPDDCFIAYAVDTNVTLAQIKGPVADYFRGVKSVDTCLPWAYVENDGIEYLFGAGLIGGGFQPAAWGWGNPASSTAWAAHAYWKQEHNGVSLYGGDVDTGHIVATANYWEADMALVKADVVTIANTDNVFDNFTWSPDYADTATATGNKSITLDNKLDKVGNEAHAARTQADALKAELDAVKAAVAKLPTTAAPAAPIDVAALAAALAPLLAPVVHAELAKLGVTVNVAS